MFTVCPKCTLTLAVTANDLRVGQGYVRCGRCSNVFNALLKLSEAPAEGAGTDVPELAQADPASTSQIHRAITAAAIDSGAAGGAAASTAAAARPTPRPSAPAAAPRTPASPAPPPSSAASASSAVAAASAPGAPVPRSASPAPAAPAAARSARPPTSLPAATPAASTPPLRSAPPQSPSLAQALRKPAAPPAALTSSPAPTSSSATARAGAAAAAAGLAAAKLTAKPPLSARPSFAGEPPAKEADTDAIDHFELVLQTLGLNADGEEPALGRPGTESEPSHTVENIVLEGDEITQSEARVSDKPLDELDLFTRRLGIATDGTAGTAAPKDAHTAMPVEPDAGTATAGAASQAVSRLAVRRARLAQAARRGTNDAASGDASLAAARAAGRDPGVAATGQLEAEGLEPDSVATDSPDLDIPGLRAVPALQQRLWLSGSLALLLLLVAQFVNHWRDALAASPTWGHPVTGLYAALGVPLQPSWDLSAYEVRQQGAESDAGAHAAIRVRFSLANHAMRAQPVPLLRLTLLDRYGRRVAERDLTPADYWPKGRSPQNFLSADERVDTEVQVRDPSADSASFELDVCLPAAAGAMHCAGDAAAAAEAAGTAP